MKFGSQHGVGSGCVVGKGVGNSDVRRAKAAVITVERGLVVFAGVNDRQHGVRRHENIRLAIMVRPVGSPLSDEDGFGALLQRGNQHDRGRMRGPAGEDHQPTLAVEPLAVGQGLDKPVIERPIP